MLRILGSARTLCGGMTRRDLLRIGGLGLAGLSLPDIFGLQQRAIEASTTRAKSFGRAKSIILIHLDVCELLPNFAKVMDRTTVLRSLTHPYPLHGVAFALTGVPALDLPAELNPRDPRNWPFFGSVVDYIEYWGAAERPRMFTPDALSNSAKWVSASTVIPSHRREPNSILRPFS